MDQSLVDAKFNVLFSKIRKLDRTEGREIAALIVAAGLLGYFATHSIAWTLLIALFMWVMRSIPYVIIRQKLVFEISMHSLAFPESADAARIREKSNSYMDKLVRKWWQ